MRRGSHDERALLASSFSFSIIFSSRQSFAKTNPVNGFDFAVAFDFDRDAIEISGQLKPSLVQESI